MLPEAVTARAAALIAIQTTAWLQTETGAPPWPCSQHQLRPVFPGPPQPPSHLGSPVAFTADWPRAITVLQRPQPFCS